MSTYDSPTDNRILRSLPDNIHAAILAYAHESALTPHAVIEGALKHFLELDALLSEDIVSAVDDTSLLAVLPIDLQIQTVQYADKNEMPAELVIELAIAHLLDPDSVTFDDCQVKVQQGSIKWLKQYANDAAATAA